MERATRRAVQTLCVGAAAAIGERKAQLNFTIGGSSTRTQGNRFLAFSGDSGISGEGLQLAGWSANCSNRQRGRACGNGRTPGRRGNLGRGGEGGTAGEAVQCSGGLEAGCYSTAWDQDAICRSRHRGRCGTTGGGGGGMETTLGDRPGQGAGGRRTMAGV